jgi:hypothetical protein
MGKTVAAAQGHGATLYRQERKIERSVEANETNNSYLFSGPAHRAGKRGAHTGPRS